MAWRNLDIDALLIVELLTRSSRAKEVSHRTHATHIHTTNGASQPAATQTGAVATSHKSKHANNHSYLQR